MIEVSIFIDKVETYVVLSLAHVPRIGEEIEINVKDVKGLFRVENVRTIAFETQLTVSKEMVLNKYVKLFVKRIYQNQ
jgi:hypothetical protein